MAYAADSPTPAPWSEGRPAGSAGSDAATDAEGRFVTRGFLGDYVVTVSYEGRELWRSVKLTRERLTEAFVLE